MRKFLRAAVRFSVVALLFYLVVVAVFMVLETGLVYPVPPRGFGNWDPADHQAEEVFFASRDGTVLHGWYFEHSRPRAQVLFCHGNGEHLGVLGDWADRFRRQHNVSVFVFDYRGYGKSEGKPFEAGVLQDGEAALRWLSERSGVAADRVVLYGRSLGGGVAVYLAANHGAAGLILDRTFDSLVGIAARLYRWLPVTLVMRNRYPAADWIASYNGPLLQLHGDADMLIPLESAQRLFAAAPTREKQFVTVPHLGHNDPQPTEFDDAVSAFLTTLERSDSSAPTNPP